jgi:hypothetical protein
LYLFLACGRYLHKYRIYISSFHRASLLSVTFISPLTHSSLDVVDIKICVI